MVSKKSWGPYKNLSFVWGADRKIHPSAQGQIFYPPVSLLIDSYRVLNAIKHVFEGLGTTKAQIRLHISAVWSAPLLFAYWKVSYQNLL